MINLDIPSFRHAVLNDFIEKYNSNFDRLVSEAIKSKGFEVPTTTDNKFQAVKLNGVNYLYHNYTETTFICWWSDEPDYVFEDNKITARLGFGTNEPTCCADIIKGFQ